MFQWPTVKGGDVWTVKETGRVLVRLLASAAVTLKEKEPGVVRVPWRRPEEVPRESPGGSEPVEEKV
jgi:hypothetical protein